MNSNENQTEVKLDSAQHNASGNSIEEKPITDNRDNDDDESDIPPLEDIIAEDSKDDSYKTKNIVIEDKKVEKPVDSDGWLDVLDNGDLKKLVLTPGLSGEPRPERGCVAVIKLITKLYDTQQEVVSECYDSIDVIVGESDVTQGIDLALPLMEQKEVSRVVIKPRFAFGKLGKLPDIPANATLDCEIHLLSVEWPNDEVLLPINERIRIGNRKREKGNFWYGRGDYSTAIQCYKSGLKFVDAQDQELADNELKKHFDEQMKAKTNDNSSKDIEELIEIRSTTYNNLAAAQLKMEAFDGALKSVDAVLILQPNNVKALYRKGKILASKGELDESIELYRKAIKLDPESKIISQELSQLINKRKKELVTERDLYKRMLELDKTDTKKGNNNQNNSKSKSWLKWGLIGGFTAAIASVVAYKVIQ